MTLSKSLYVAGLQCHKLLWWKVHEPDAVELQPDKVLQDRFDQGAQVGTLARAEFPGGQLIDHDSAESRLAATQRAIASSAPALFEGTFQVQDRVYPERSEGTNPERSEGSSTSIRIHADVLLPDGDGWKLIEVKSASSQKPEHIPDAAVQAWVLTQNGINLTGIEIMHLNKDFRSPDQGALLTRTDVTPAVNDLLGAIPGEIEKQLAMLDGPLPEVAIGIHCDEPRECPFQKRCWPQSRDHISKLHSIGPKRAASYMSAGVHWIKDYQEKGGAKAPSNQALTIRRQIKSMREDRLIVEPGLAKALEPFTGRLGFLDFETISRAVPVWPGMAPWEQAAAQFSYHEAQPDGSYTHSAFSRRGTGGRAAVAREADGRGDRERHVGTTMSPAYQQWHCLEHC